MNATYTLNGHTYQTTQDADLSSESYPGYNSDFLAHFCADAYDTTTGEAATIIWEIDHDADEVNEMADMVDDWETPSRVILHSYTHDDWEDEKG